MAQLKKTKINDIFAKGGIIRADGRMVHDMYLMQVKTPAESTDALGLLQGGRQRSRASRPSPRMAESKCALLRK